ncbi:MAG TPA: DUF1257 domain-containing protein [Candidatus Paceibacterota bacterium]|nr:DUF1257 domain-containing protein [Candidatus Paceibacterota bacterium]
METEFKTEHEKCLLDAIKEAGFSAQVSEEPVELENSHSKKKVKAHIRITKSQFGGYGDMGFEKNNGKYVCHVDDTDHRAHGNSKTKLGRITQLYSSLVIQKQVKKSSRFSMISKKENENGEIKIRVRRY